VVDTTTGLDIGLNAGLDTGLHTAAGVLALSGAFVTGAVLALVVLGAALGAVVALAAARRSTDARLTAALRSELRNAAHEQSRAAADERDTAVRAALGHLATMNRSLAESERAIGRRELAGERQLIDQHLGDVRSELARVGELVHQLERDREAKFGRLENELRRQHEGVAALTETTAHLREALASQKTRGQWGERMADDVLRLAGFVEGVNYRRQRTAEGTTGRPDYTFLLPNDLVLHMDVKFPLDNYLRYLECESELEQRQRRDQFLRDVRDRVRELTTRGYLDGGDTVDCLLLFIPNEQVYGFVQQHGNEILDEALRHGIVLCSPLTLYAVLAVVRQAVDHFRLERTSSEILALLGEFTTQWEKFVDALEGQQKRFDLVAREFSQLTGTRRRALERPLDRIEALRASVDVDVTDEYDDAPVRPLAVER
jgi:DNA recombination protein RmuC